MLRLSRLERASEGMLEGRSALRKCVFREGIQVAMRLNQWAESWVRRAPLAGMPYWSVSMFSLNINELLDRPFPRFVCH